MEYNVGSGGGGDNTKIAKKMLKIAWLWRKYQSFVIVKKMSRLIFNFML